MTTRKTKREAPASARQRRASAVVKGSPLPKGVRLTDTGWETIKQLLAREMDGLQYLLYIDAATVVEDTGRVITIEVRTAEMASHIARHHAVHVQRVLALVGRPRTIVRLRANLAPRHDAPDFYVRDIDTAATPSAKPDAA